MVGDLGRHHGLSTIEFEALGQMGWKHSSHHDKASFQPSGLLDAALSACFCDRCETAMRDGGSDPAACRTHVRAALEQWIGQGDAMAPAAAPAGPAQLAGSGAKAPWLDAVLAVRARAVGQLADLVRGVSTKRRAVQVHPHPWFTGSQLAAASATVFGPQDERVLTCYGDGPDAISALLADAGPLSLRSSPRRICIWPKAPQFRSDDDLTKLREALERHGVESLAVYHLGLLPWRTIERVARTFVA
jgi:hypothetical protein